MTKICPENGGLKHQHKVGLFKNVCLAQAIVPHTTYQKWHHYDAGLEFRCYEVKIEESEKFVYFQCS